MATTGIKIHGGIDLLGQDAEIENLELEELATDPTIPNAGRLWLNSSDLRVKYAEGTNQDENNTVIREVANTDDLAALATVMTNSVSSIEVFNVTNNGTNVLELGQPVYSVSALSVDLGIAADYDRKSIIGLVASNSIQPHGGTGQMLSSGQLTGTVSQWAAVTGNPAGLVPNAVYFLDVVLGKLTTTPPSADGQFICPIGTAISSTVFIIRIDRTIQL